MAYLESNNLLHPSQFAYRKKTSTEHEFLTMIEEWRKMLDFWTFQKLLTQSIIKFFGFHENFIKLIESYLQKRSIKVKVNNAL